MNEIWKEIDGYPYYYVSNIGRVKSVFRNKEKILTPREYKKFGYLFVNLYDRSFKMHSIKIHRLVANAFIPNPDNLPQVNHKDENKANNHVSNLEWCTAKYNLTYNDLQKRQHLLQKRKIGAFDSNLVLVNTFPSVTDAAEHIYSLGKTKTVRSAICNICCAANKQKTKENYGYLWRYLEPSHRKDNV